MVAEKWGILTQDGQTALAYDSFIDLDVKNESRVLSSPVENEGFAAYNKVETPVDVSVTIGFSSRYGDQTSALATLDKLVREASALSIVTPAATYINMTLESYSYRRKESEGMVLLVAELHLAEVRSVAVGASYRPKRATSASRVNTGQTQGKKAHASAGMSMKRGAARHA